MTTMQPHILSGNHLWVQCKNKQKWAFLLCKVYKYIFEIISIEIMKLHRVNTDTSVRTTSNPVWKKETFWSQLIYLLSYIFTSKMRKVILALRTFLFLFAVTPANIHYWISTGFLFFIHCVDDKMYIDILWILNAFYCFAY